MTIGDLRFGGTDVAGGGGEIVTAESSVTFLFLF